MEMEHQMTRCTTPSSSCGTNGLDFSARGDTLSFNVGKISRLLTIGKMARYSLVVYHVSLLSFMTLSENSCK